MGYVDVASESELQLDLILRENDQIKRMISRCHIRLLPQLMKEQSLKDASSYTTLQLISSKSQLRCLAGHWQCIDNAEASRVPVYSAVALELSRVVE